jgi:pantoate--beta-alanine ligase
MGYLHEGHLSLVRRARADNDHVVVSIFVNPTQFGPNEDLDRYPRDEERDLQLLEAERADIVFIPSADEIYPSGFDEWVEVAGPVAERLEGAHRPGHFRGVTTVCARLFRIVRPDRAYFGQKDAQQLRVIRQMVQEQRIPVDIIPMPIVREPDGLAMSSRNVYLSPEQRKAAVALSRGLAAGRAAVSAGATDANDIRRAVEDVLNAEELIGVDYVSISDEHSLEELNAISRPALILLAARLGITRLIDNTIVVPKGMPVPLELQGLMEP